MMTLFSIPLSLLKVNPIEIKYRSALKDEELTRHLCFIILWNSSSDMFLLASNLSLALLENAYFEVTP
jgi:hypothetical protein